MYISTVFKAETEKTDSAIIILKLKLNFNLYRNPYSNYDQRPGTGIQITKKKGQFRF